jgi:hemolysin III
VGELEGRPTTRRVVKPALRGILHHYAFFVALAGTMALLLAAPSRRATIAAAVYGASLSGLLGVSGLFHRVTWSVRARRLLARLDHAMIGVLIAGTYTPFGVLGMTGAVATRLLLVVWAGAFASAMFHLLWIDVPKQLSAALYVGLGWVGVIAAPQLVDHVGWTAPLLLLAGALVYSAGAIVYAFRRPDPMPATFGYHEVFHALVVAAAALHYAAVVAILPYGAESVQPINLG